MKSIFNQQQDTPLTATVEEEDEEEKAHKSVEEIKILSIYDTYSKWKKNWILFLISCLGFLSLFDEMAYLPAISTLIKDFKTTKALGLLTVSVYLFAMSISSLIWGVLADYQGRKVITIIGLSVFILSSIGCYFSPNIYIFLITRTLQGCFVSVCAVIGQGTIADIYDPNTRGTPYGIFYGFYHSAALLGTVLGGQIAQYYGWRSIFILIAILSFILLIAYVLTIPETQQYKVICTYQSQQNITLLESDQVAKPTLTNPCLTLLYLIDPTNIPYVFVLIFSYIAVNCSGLLITTELAQPPYSFQASTIGILLVPIATAFTIGSIVGGKLSDLIMIKCFQKSKVLEGRMIPGLIFSILLSIGLIIYGWAIQYSIHASVVVLGQTLSGFGQTACRPGMISYFTDKYQDHAASIIGANTFVQQLLTSIVFVFTVQMVQIIHEGPFFTSFALLNILTTAVAAVIIYRKLNLSKSSENEPLL